MNNEVKYNFNNKVAFVTGASSGIGRATAMAFGKYGAKVMIADVNVDSGGQTAHLIEKATGKAEFIKCDVSKASEVKAAIEKTVSIFGGLDLAFNNAGVEGAQGSIADGTEENWDRVINTNLKGVWLCMKYEIPQMLKKGGAIVNCSSVAGLSGFMGIAPYVASKHGIIGLTKTAALEYAKSNIRINAVCPGVIQTSMVDRILHGDVQIRKQMIEGEPMGRLGQPEEIAAATLWLCSGQSSFVVGHPLVVDGGWLAQ